MYYSFHFYHTTVKENTVVSKYMEMSVYDRPMKRPIKDCYIKRRKDSWISDRIEMRFPIMSDNERICIWEGSLS